MKKRILSIALLLIAMRTLAEPIQHELSGYGMFGLSSLSYAGREYRHGLGGGGGVGYAVFFNETWGLTLGVEAATFSTSLRNEQLEWRDVQQYRYGGVTEEMHLISIYANYREELSALYLHVPLMAQLHISVNQRYAFYAAAGVKLGLALRDSYAVSIESLTTIGYFPETDQTFADMPNHGFSTRNNLTTSGSLGLKVDLSPTVEAGLRSRLSERMALYAGFYLTYGLLNVLPDADFAAPLQPGSSILASELHLLSAGVKLKFAFSLSRKKCRCGCNCSEYKLPYRTWH